MERKKLSKICGLCRFSLQDEELVQAVHVKKAITEAFNERRAFPFYPDISLLNELKAGKSIEQLRNGFINIKNSVFSEIAGDDHTTQGRLAHDTRISARLVQAISYLHKALAETKFTSMINRRFVIIKELHGKPTFYHISDKTTVLTHIGQGPVWQEIPTVYLGLKIFDVVDNESKRGNDTFYDALKKILIVEERAIETGFTHVETYSSDYSRALNDLVDALIRYSGQAFTEVKEEAEKVRVKPFSGAQREKILHLLDARETFNDMYFDYYRNIKAVERLERYARRYKRSGDRKSLKEIISLLVSASGHDVHEIRNRSNIALERILAPKEYDAPLAMQFYNLHVGEYFKFSFVLPYLKQGYKLRVYNNECRDEIFIENDIDYQEYDLSYDARENRYHGTIPFTVYGHYDYVVLKKKIKKYEWVQEPGCSGRINVLPNFQGQIILEIFVDIHGHTRMYWKDAEGHPGLVYNENGEVIRLGRFSDVAAHLEDLKKRYFITGIYLLGVQRRGTHWEDWAPEASSPSPFSPMSLVDIEPSLGGEEEFKNLVQKAHQLDVKVIVDIVPHLNRHSEELPDENVVFCYDAEGRLIPRASTDGRYGSWNDGKLLNYRRFEIWQWLKNSIEALLEKYDIDGIRFDSAHAVPIMMKKNNFPFVYDRHRSVEELVEGRIIVNDRWDDHFVTTGYYDCQCRDFIAIPLHQYLMLSIQRILKARNKDFFIHIAECFWGHERFLARSGIVPYNSSLFKICENIFHGKTDVREIYHIYDNYYKHVLPHGTDLLGILGNHDERRALNTFGQRGLRSAVALTSFMSNIIMDFEGSAEGEGWKVFLDNIYVNWNQFEYASHRSVEQFYSELYEFHANNRGKGYLVWANNNNVAAAMKFTANDIWIGAFSFSDANENASIQFDNPALPLDDDTYYRVLDPIYSPITKNCNFFTGKELKVSHINTTIAYTERVKFLKLEKLDKIELYYTHFLKDSFYRLCKISNNDHFNAHLAFDEVIARFPKYKELEHFIVEYLVPMFWDNDRDVLTIGLKRIFYHIYRCKHAEGKKILRYFNKMMESSDEKIANLGRALKAHNDQGPILFMSAEADPFSKSGGLANVVYELPRELARAGEDVYVITGYYRNGAHNAVSKMKEAIEKYKVTYTGINVSFKIMDRDYQIGVHSAVVDGITYYLLDHFEFFDGLYWGVTSEEKLRRRVAFARASAEVICHFQLNPLFTVTNDAYAGLFNGIVRSDHYYYNNPNFSRTTFLHVIHNGGWQYFDSYDRYEHGFDLFNLFNIPTWCVDSFIDPVYHDRLNCMATAIRFADKTITVSPSYAKQIEYACDGLEHILQDVIGIGNAIGKDFHKRIIERFNESGFEKRNYTRLCYYIKNHKDLFAKIKKEYPEILKSLSAVSSIKNKTRRAIVLRVLRKMMLQLERGLTIDPDLILCSMIHRIADQKGFQLLLEASEGLVKKLGFQFIIGGAVSSGDNTGEAIAHGLWLLSQYYPQNVHVSFGFQDISVPLLSSDLFCMPSLNEPGGIAQLEAFACGCLVVARATGGLRDTVVQVKQVDKMVEGNGFLFSDYSSWAFYDAMERAAYFLKNNDEATILAARINAEHSVYFWDKSAHEYIEKIYDLKEIIHLI